MKAPVAILVFVFSLALSGCDTGLLQSDMIGVFTTENGDCTEEGDVGLTIRQNELHIGFYCFLAKCGEMQGTIEKGGHFYIKDTNGYYIQGQLRDGEAKGLWYTNISGDKCSGRWFATRNRKRKQ